MSAFRHHHKLINILLIALLFTFVAGCQQKVRRDPAFATIRPALPPQPSETNGAIYQRGHDVRLFEDLKARRIGDILTVQLVESTNASKSADTTLAKATNTSITNPTIFNTSPQFSLSSSLPFVNTKDLNLTTTLASDHDFTGTGETSQQNALTGNVSVTVVEVLPNGNLIVRGEKRITLNNGNEYIRLSGIIRTVDISSTNTVLSSRIADVTIMYTGEGQVANSSLMGWLSRFFTSVVFPF